MQNISVFTEYLTALAGYSRKVDSGNVTDSEFIEFQKLEARITNAYKVGYYKEPEYRALIQIYQYLKDGFRIVLGL